MVGRVVPPPARQSGAGEAPAAAGAYRRPAGWGSRAARLLGPGLLVAVGYMDPGNWATDIEAGSRLGADLLFVVAGSGLAAVLFQVLAARLGLAGHDLARACRDRYPPGVRHVLWLLAELAIVATDVAEVLGAALALNLLFGAPLAWGVALAGLDLLVVLALRSAGFVRLEAFVAGLIAVIAVSLSFNLALSPPDAAMIAAGLVPDLGKLQQTYALYLAVGIVGATIMPHNLYLHSALVRARSAGTDAHAGPARSEVIGTCLALGLATAVNGALLILAASTFHAHGQDAVASIAEAHSLLAPLTGAALSGTIFALGLLAAGQSSTVTGTMAGQAVLDGFLGVRLAPWRRRLITRSLAVVPALLGVLWLGDGGAGALLVLSQVVLAAQLPFALYPLIRITSDPRTMGRLASPPLLAVLAWTLFALLTAADAWLLAHLLGV